MVDWLIDRRRGEETREGRGEERRGEERRGEERRGEERRGEERRGKERRGEKRRGEERRGEERRGEDRRGEDERRGEERRGVERRGEERRGEERLAPTTALSSTVPGLTGWQHAGRSERVITVCLLNPDHTQPEGYRPFDQDPVLQVPAGEHRGRCAAVRRGYPDRGAL